MLPLLIVSAVLLLGFQLWWAVAYTYAYSQVRATTLLIQVIQGMIYVLFFLVILWRLFSAQDSRRLLAPALLLAALVIMILWRVLDGPALLVRHYPRRWRDVLLFRRPAVDLKRRVRSK